MKDQELSPFSKKHKIEVNRRFGKWTVLRDAGSGCYCQCDCGRRAMVRKNNLLRGASKSCGRCNTPLKPYERIP